MAAINEGLEVNVLGLSLGVDPGGLAVKLPGLGRVGKQPYYYAIAVSERVIGWRLSHRRNGFLMLAQQYMRVHIRKP